MSDTAAPSIPGSVSAKEPVPFSIRVLRRLNPAMIAVLRSPLHAALSRSLLVLAYTGRHSGTRYELPLSYATIGERTYLCTRNSKWCHNLRDGRPVTVTLRGRAVAMRPALLDPASNEALEGLRAFLVANPGTGVKLYHVSRGQDGRSDESDLKREVLRSTVVRLEMIPSPN
jgi:hypothetical protein